MDAVRDRVEEHARNKRRKLLLGIIAVIILIIVAVVIEANINNKPTDVVIEKSRISDEKAQFIPLKELDTNIIVVKATDGSYRIAFDDCIGCYIEHNVHGQFKNNSDNTGLVCKNCKNEVMYDEMGYLPEESMPYPIPEVEITSLEDTFVIPAEYLEEKKTVLEEFRKGNAVNNYSENPN